ncbi:MAG TPA: hypothetical protein PLO61_02275 [Fimbriimonadaceae bacterium]|nr:hypothetical protein [Fimbriimonadaceae bacterium]HRJ31934.1 hypothetical protein [Fimbriimonadaceae bacterium]
MPGFWEEELTPEKQEELLEKAAQEITKRRLEAPALFFLESHKPLASVAAQATLVFSPFIIPFFGFDNVNQYTALLKERQNVEKLIAKIEEHRDGQREALSHG